MSLCRLDRHKLAGLRTTTNLACHHCDHPLSRATARAFQAAGRGSGENRIATHGEEHELSRQLGRVFFAQQTWRAEPQHGCPSQASVGWAKARTRRAHVNFNGVARFTTRTTIKLIMMGSLRSAHPTLALSLPGLDPAISLRDTHCPPKRDYRVTPLRGGPVMTGSQNAAGNTPPSISKFCPVM